MTTSLSRAALSVFVLSGLAAGCASSNRHGALLDNSTVTSDDIDRQAGNQPIEQLLQAKVPGVLITRTADGGIAVQIRGNGTFYGATAPLYVVDDVPFEAGPGGTLKGINPYDIDTIRVLKNPEDTGLYGMRGANGVIVITMKKPNSKN
jgi:TonB-dependent SusC/RagA subfamily outer membrane receptor